MPPPKLIEIQGEALAAVLLQFVGVPEIVNVPLLEPAAANAALLLSVTEVHVCACSAPVAVRQRNNAVSAPRKLITSD